MNGKQWKRAREQRTNLTQEDVVFHIRAELGDEHKVTKTTFSRFENGEATLEPLVLAFLAQLYNVTFIEFDPESASQYRRLRDLVGSIPGCVTADRRIA